MSLETPELKASFLSFVKANFQGINMFKKTLVCKAVILAIAARKLNEGGNIA